MKQSLHISCCPQGLAAKHSSASVPVDLTILDKGHPWKQHFCPSPQPWEMKVKNDLGLFKISMYLPQKGNCPQRRLSVFCPVVPFPKTYLWPCRKPGLLIDQGMCTWTATCISVCLCMFLCIYAVHTERQPFHGLCTQRSYYCQARGRTWCWFPGTRRGSD